METELGRAQGDGRGAQSSSSIATEYHIFYLPVANAPGGRRTPLGPTRAALPSGKKPRQWSLGRKLLEE